MLRISTAPFPCTSLPLSSMKTILNSIQATLHSVEENARLRVLSTYGDGVDFFSNDYLGLAQQNVALNSDFKHGAGGSRLISGNHEEYGVTERYLAKTFGYEAAVIFPTGYMTNLGLLSSLPQRSDVVLYDELCHASIRDGLRLSHAKTNKFSHNDTAHLKKLIDQHANQAPHVYVVVESVYSMDGDMAPLVEMAEICNLPNVGLIVDEAHAVGVYGWGLVASHQLQDSVFATVVTFSKALGLHGGAVLSHSILKDFLVNHARSLIYTTGLPPETVHRIRAHFELLETEGPERRAALEKNIQFFKNNLNNLAASQLIPSQTPIQALVIGNHVAAVQLENVLLSGGLLTKAILHPTVPSGTERIRISLHSYNTEAEISMLCQRLNEYFEE
ncbi:aminotransferase class I/II-fold pyridoxal phosphate-dependent enzyme [Phaeocystidibacter marisrubri]|uniref:Aminotransferase class I/II-fold pyridoxal phosphate-dependent enzyme n=2 Tax=Phaeocystidibacter marisrubri TaxID=1577780 RepID=A0A6L3ZDQ0_9FLAO|nr:aminotransferase class I/II-fold pyridoxal phosphate-dependent enzyme [Phaeocystidibacter marisrubri]